MWIVKMLGAFLIFLSTSFVGFVFANYLTIREKNLIGFRMIVEYLKSEILFKQMHIFEAFKSTIVDLKNSSSLILEEAIANNQQQSNSFKDSWSRAVNSCFSELGFNNADKKLIEDFGLLLGGSDLEGQQNNFSLTVERLNNQIENAAERKKKLYKLYLFLGMGGGAALALLLI